MTKLHRAFVVLVAAMLLLFLCAGAVVPAYAETDENAKIGEVENTPADEEESASLEVVAAQFIEYLKDKYGEDYELYYNAIIEQWGSIEGYLLAFGDKLPEQYQTGWEKFVGWLGKYSVIWAPALAVVILIIAVIVGRKKFKKLKEWFFGLVEKLVNKRLTPIETELNLQSKAIISQIHAQKALMGTAERFSDNVKELEAAEKELLNG